MLLSIFISNAQSFYPYSFSKLNQSYTNLIGATSLTNGNLWDDTVVIAPIGFPFKFHDNSNFSDTVFFSTWGFLAFRNEYYPSPLIWMGRSMVPFAADMITNADSIGNTTSDISYQTTGAVGNRIFKMQCKNIGFYDDTTGTDSLNFQVWLYETTNVIEYRYGPSQFSPNSWYWQDGGCRIGIYNEVTIDTIGVNYSVDNCTYVTGTSATAAATQISTSFSFFDPNSANVLTDGPANSQVFQFTPLVNSSVKDVNSLFDDVKIISNQTQQSFVITHSGQVNKLSVMDLQGNQIATVLHPNTKHVLSASHLAKGMYLICVFDSKENKKVYKVIH